MRDTSETYYENLFDTCVILPEKLSVVKKQAEAIYSHREIYEEVDNYVNCHWIIVGLIHMMEASFSMTSNLHNGERWDKETILVPKGCGPFDSWVQAAIDALLLKKSIMPKHGWTIPGIAYFLERYNGLGYAYRNVNSPYLWSYSNHGEDVGKYTSDGSYDKNAISLQPGAMTVYQYIRENLMDLSGLKDKYEDREEKIIIKYDPKNFNYKTAMFQNFLNNDCRISLISDGKAGQKTSDACKTVFGFYLSGDIRNESPEEVPDRAIKKIKECLLEEITDYLEKFEIK